MVILTITIDPKIANFGDRVHILCVNMHSPYGPNVIKREFVAETWNEGFKLAYQTATKELDKLIVAFEAREEALVLAEIG